MFIDYTRLEEKIFEAIQSYFEQLPPLASDDYNNGFDDIVSQYGFGGDEYVVVDSEYDDILEAIIEEKYNELSGTEKKALQVSYETFILDDYFFDPDKNEYFYSDSDLLSAFSNRFKSWVEDNFSVEDLLDEDEEEDYDVNISHEKHSQ